MKQRRAKKKSVLRQMVETVEEHVQSQYQLSKQKYLRWEKFLVAIPLFYLFFSAWLHIVAATHLSLIETILGFATVICLAQAIHLAQKLRVDWSWERFYIPVISAVVSLFLGPIGGGTLREYELKKPRLVVGQLDHYDGMRQITTRGGKAYVYMSYVKFKVDGKEYVQLCTECSPMEKNEPMALKIGQHFVSIITEDREATKKLRKTMDMGR